MSQPVDLSGGEQVEGRVQKEVARRVDGAVLWIARHWLALFNALVALYLLLPFLAPVLADAGLSRPASLIYSVYSATCHQLPERSYFLFGEQPFYSLSTLEKGGLPEDQGLFQRRAYRGNESAGYKVAVCQRDVAIYGSVMLAGLLFGMLRGRVRGIGLKIYLLLLIPIALDGLSQLFGLRESNWWLRTFTGALFGGASVWLAYPYIEAAMRDVVRSEEMRLR
ncbi:MAG: DUF2085 domain-containing protein [Caldilineaceae bacterium SB0670_bin_27]|uniref:DUF2085 domain-containing protein n=1 Tax=Caldilineaceae bacterium SB0664_bin_27 TaxID=2605260 RepID=A0A6B0YZK4_9CHLR|nr:DUF2085 domain-containing protein [Caldilineaceae bacterium SB0664_bin_27]MYJ79213.1 DUF2085 domain-containing protein [Caldilineaceae bacterium SB0670_bin_27]